MAQDDKSTKKSARTSSPAHAHAFSNTLKTLKTASGKAGQYFSLPELAKTHPNVNKLPVSIRIVLESVLRNCDGRKVTAEHVAELANWRPNVDRTNEILQRVNRLAEMHGGHRCGDVTRSPSFAKGFHLVERVRYAKPMPLLRE